MRFEIGDFVMLVSGFSDCVGYVYKIEERYTTGSQICHLVWNGFDPPSWTMYYNHELKKYYPFGKDFSDKIKDRMK